MLLDDLSEETREQLGLREQVPCSSCETVSPFRKLNLIEHEGHYAFLCDGCAEEKIVRPMAEFLSKRLETDSELRSQLEDIFSAGALWSDDPQVRDEMAKRLKQLLEHPRASDEEEP